MKIWVTLIASFGLLAQEAPQPAKPKLSSIIGEVKTKDAAKLTVKTDAGDTYTVSLDEKTAFVKVQPGEKDLSKAAKIAPADLNVGDRVMARGTVAEAEKTMPARMIVVMTKSDLEQKQAKERAEWQTRGGSGVVDEVTPDIVVVTQKVRGETKKVALAVSPNTRIRRYSTDSVRFHDAKASTVAEIKKGDQIRFLGTKNEDGTKVTTEEIVYGTFRLIPATVLSADATTGEIKVTDLDTKKPIIVLASSDSTIRKLPEMMARMLAMQVNGTAASAAMGGMGQGAGAGMGQRPQGAPGAPAGQGAPGGAAPGGAPGGAPGPGGMRGPGGFGGGGPRGGGDLASVLERAPAIQVADLKPGDALIINSTAPVGSARVSAITILAGVEPILTSAPRSAGAINLGSWSLGTGEAAAAQ